MAAFCPQCGTAVDAGDRFCAECGHRLPQPAAAAKPKAAPPVPKSAPLVPEEAPNDGFLVQTFGGLRWPIMIAAAVLIILIAAMLLFRDPGSVGADNGASANVADGPEPGAVLSEVATIYTKANAMLRDAPTTQGSTVIERLPPGEEMVGAWVAGRDPTTRWLRVTRAGATYAYIWEGNLTNERPPEATDLATVIQIDPRQCTFGGVLSAIYDKMARYDEEAREVTAAAPFRAAGLDQQLVPELTEWKDDHWRVDVPLAGRWRGLQVKGLYTAGVIDSEGNSGIVFAEPKSKVIATLNHEGFALGPDGYRELDLGGISVSGEGDSTVLSCGG